MPDRIPGSLGQVPPANVFWHPGAVGYEDRCRVLGQQGLVIWFTGLSGAGKSTIAVELERELHLLGRAVYRLDGDNIRMGLNADLGFSEEDRHENIRRVAEVAALFKDAGLMVLVCFISPFRRMRDFARAKAGAGSFIEVYVQADLEVCRARDPKGLYQKALAGEIADFTGVSSPFEEPLHPELTIHTGSVSPAQAAGQILEYLRRHGYIASRA